MWGNAYESYLFLINGTDNKRIVFRGFVLNAMSKGHLFTIGVSNNGGNIDAVVRMGQLGSKRQVVVIDTCLLAQASQSTHVLTSKNTLLGK